MTAHGGTHLSISGTRHFFRMIRKKNHQSQGFAIQMPDGTAVVFLNGEVRRIVFPDQPAGYWYGGSFSNLSKNVSSPAG